MARRELTPEGFENLSLVLRTLTTDAAMDEKSDKEIAELLSTHIADHFDLTDARFALLSQAVARLRRSPGGPLAPPDPA